MDHLPTRGYVLPTYLFREPPEIAAGKPSRHPVVIVGGGLAGLAMACDLAVRGVRAVLLDEDDTVGVRGASSRGIVYAQKTLEFFARVGIYDRVRAKGVTWTRGKTLAGDDVVYEFDMATATPSLQPPFVNLQQFYIEWFLVDRIAALGLTDLRWRNRVVAAHACEDHVLLSVETPAGRYEIEAEWLVDASGLHSLVRDGFGLDPRRAARTPDRWCICDVRFAKPLPIERWTWVEAPFNEDRAVWQHLMADDVWRMDFQMLPDADPEAVSRPEVAAERVRRQLGADVEFELVWVGPYAYRSHCLDRFRHGRVFFIGDAAHVMSPFGARGGNSGIQDAENLAWKLALVLAGGAPDALLESYDAERRAAAHVNIEVTDRTARFLAPRSPSERRIRDAVIGLAREYPFARPLVNTGRLSVANAYAPCVPGTPGGTAVQNVPVSRAGEDVLGLADLARQLGTVFIGVWFSNGSGSRALARDLVALERSGRPLRVFACGAPIEGIAALGDPDGRLARAVKATPGAFALVRPDLYLAALLPETTAAGVADALDRALRTGPVIEEVA